MSLLTIKNLSVFFDDVAVTVGVSLSVEAGDVLGIVGESGSGKSVSMLAVMGLIEAPGRIAADEMTFDEQNLLALSPKKRRKILGKDIAMIFQDPATCLNPSFTIGYQIAEVLTYHMGLSGAVLRKKVIELLEKVGIPDAKNRVGAYPHELSGGMRQRAMIAMAIACKPKLLIADEPTTALDTTIQADIISLLMQLQKDHGMALVFISHDLSVVAQIARRVVVMYAGQVVEQAKVPDIFTRPHHPYTQALLESIPEHNTTARRLKTLPGVIPSATQRPIGCWLSPRCPYADNYCCAYEPGLTVFNDASIVRCFKPLNTAAL